jgi:hypothetical protein
MVPKWYGIGWYKDADGDRRHVIIRNLRAEQRHEAEREARRVCWSRGYRFEGVYPVRPERYQQRKKGRRKHGQANLWWKRPAEKEATGR